MKDTIEKPCKTRQKSAKGNKQPQPAAELHDPWRDWQPQWQLRGGLGDSPHDLQERHAPTEPVRLRHGDSTCQRRIVDARLWDSLDALQQQAAIDIAMTYERLSRGMGFASSDWQRVPGGSGGGGDGHALLAGPYIDWAKACALAKISHSMVIDILCFGISCTALDRDRRVRAGASRANLVAGLSLYAKLQGWRA